MTLVGVLVFMFIAIFVEIMRRYGKAAIRSALIGVDAASLWIASAPRAVRASFDIYTGVSRVCSADAGANW